jgi:hypothetical protein
MMAKKKTTMKMKQMDHNARQSKIGFARDDIEDKFDEDHKPEKVWLDFGKQHTRVKEYNVAKNNDELNLNEHKMYFCLPPCVNLLPSYNVIFELVHLDNKSSANDVTVGWGSFPIINGEFAINTGKFKLPMIAGSIDFTTNKFKDIEDRYIRNIDEWLCNLYIEIKNIELYDFKEYQRKVEFKRTKLKRRQNFFTKVGTGLKNTASKFGIIDKDSSGESSDDIMSDDGFSDDEVGVVLEETHLAKTQTIDYHRYKYCVSKAEDFIENMYEQDEIALRKIQYITSELLNDLGIKKGNYWEWF